MNSRDELGLAAQALDGGGMRRSSFTAPALDSGEMMRHRPSYGSIAVGQARATLAGEVAFQQAIIARRSPNLAGLKPIALFPQENATEARLPPQKRRLSILHGSTETFTRGQHRASSESLGGSGSGEETVPQPPRQAMAGGTLVADAPSSEDPLNMPRSTSLPALGRRPSLVVGALPSLAFNVQRSKGSALPKPGSLYHFAAKELKAYWAGGLVNGSWTARIERCRLNTGFMFIGVCDLAGRCAWGLHPYSGLLYRITRNRETGRISFDEPPPKGFPDGNRTRVMISTGGKPTNLRERAEGAVIDCVVDDASGTLYFGINGEPLLKGLTGFPLGQPLRRWALICDKGDKVVVEAG